MTENIRLAIIGGSGLYEMSGLQESKEYILDTPFGRPSAPIVTGSIKGHRIDFLARHGLGHRLTPTEVPYQANIYALKTLGVEDNRSHSKRRYVKFLSHHSPYA